MGERFVVRENIDGDREAWEVWDRERYDIAEPFEACCNLSLGEAEAQARRLAALLHGSQPATAPDLVNEGLSAGSGGTDGS